MKNKKVFYCFLIILLIFVVILAIFNKQSIKEINDFQSCVSAGYPVLESYPLQCKAQDGRIFTEILSEDFCGKSTFGVCLSDSDCIKSGCSGQICQSENEESIITTCEFKECYSAEIYGMQCKCINKKCQWNSKEN